MKGVYGTIENKIDKNKNFYLHSVKRSVRIGKLYEFGKEVLRWLNVLFVIKVLILELK